MAGQHQGAEKRRGTGDAARRNDELGVELLSVRRVSPALTEGVELPANGISLEHLERSLVLQALERCGWNQTRAATLLGLNRDQIRYRIEKFGLERPS